MIKISKLQLTIALASIDNEYYSLSKSVLKHNDLYSGIFPGPRII